MPPALWTSSICQFPEGLTLQIWGTRLAAEVGASFLIGWAIKAVVTNLGGKESFQATRRVMFGFIAGDLVAALVFMLIGMIYYNVTGKAPVSYLFFPSIS